MALSNRRFGVVQWSSETGDHLAAPGDCARLLADGVGGRVVLLIGSDGPFEKIRFGDSEYRVSPSKLARIDNGKHAVGDVLSVDGAPAVVRDAIWHYGRSAPFYLLELNGKKSSRRYFNDDLE